MKLTIEKIREILLHVWNEVKQVFTEFIKRIQPFISFIPSYKARIKYNKRVWNRQRLYEKRRALGRC